MMIRNPLLVMLLLSVGSAASAESWRRAVSGGTRPDRGIIWIDADSVIRDTDTVIFSMMLIRESPARPEVVRTVRRMRADCNTGDAIEIFSNDYLNDGRTQYHSGQGDIETSRPGMLMWDTLRYACGRIPFRRAEGDPTIFTRGIWQLTNEASPTVRRPSGGAPQAACREVVETVYVNGREQRTPRTFCRDASGRWAPFEDDVTRRLMAVTNASVRPSEERQQTEILQSGNINEIRWYPVQAPSGATMFQSGSTTVQSRPTVVRYNVRFQDGPHVIIQLQEARCSDKNFQVIGTAEVAADGRFAMRRLASPVWGTAPSGSDVRELVDGGCT